MWWPMTALFPEELSCVSSVITPLAGAKYYIPEDSMAVSWTGLRLETCANFLAARFGHERDRCFNVRGRGAEIGFPSRRPSASNLAGCEQRPEEHRHGLGAGQRGLDLDAAAELFVQALDSVGGPSGSQSVGVRRERRATQEQPSCRRPAPYFQMWVQRAFASNVTQGECA